MTFPAPSERDPLVAQIIEASRRLLSPPDASALAAGFLPWPAADARSEPTGAQLDAVYESACSLCDEGAFRLAAPLALHLVTYLPGEPRYSFIAGTCLQRLGVHAHAARMFGFTLLSGGDHAATLYRFGECLLALGDHENAAKALDAAFEVARDLEETREVQAMCETLMERISRKG